MPELLRLKEVTIGYRRGHPLLPPISIAIQSGDLIGILGPNGSGKSTFLKTMLGLLPPLSGELQLPLGRRPRLGYVPQGSHPDFAYPLSVLQVTLMGRAHRLGLVKRPGKADRDIALEQLQSVGLEKLVKQPFRSLSGGQQQRVLVARALTAEPELLILDEPTSEMDPAAEHSLLSLVSRLVASRNIGVAFVTHQISAAAGFAASVILLDSTTNYFETGPTESLITSEKMTRLYGRSVEVRKENGRVLVWLSAHEPAAGGFR